MKTEELSRLRLCVPPMFKGYENQKDPGNEAEIEMPMKTEENQKRDFLEAKITRHF